MSSVQESVTSEITERTGKAVTTPSFAAEAPVRRCPKCRADYLTRSRTRGRLERLLRLSGVQPFRCLACYNRFFALGRD
jgi:hypothetical protein